MALAPLVLSLILLAATALPRADAALLPAFDWGACRLAVANTTARAPNGTIVIGVVDSIEVMAMCMALQGADLGAGHNVSIVFFDDENSEDRARPAAELMEGYPVVGVIGSFTSRMSMALQNAGLAASRIPQVSHAATSALLSNKTRFPHFLRTPSTDALTAYAMVMTFAHYGVTHIGVMATLDSYGESSVAALSEYARRMDPPIKLDTIQNYSSTLSMPEQVNLKMFELYATRAEAYVLFCTTPTCLPVLEQARVLNMLARPSVWLVGGGGAAVNSIDLFSNYSDLAAAIRDNTAIVTYSTSLGSGPVRSQFEADLRKFTSSGSSAVFTPWTDHEAMFAALVGLRFTGATGPVSFDANGDRFATITLSTWLPDARTLTVVGNWSVAGGLVVDPRHAPFRERSPGGGGGSSVGPLVAALVAGSAGVALALAVGVAAFVAVQHRTRRLLHKADVETRKSLVPAREIVLGPEVGRGLRGAVYKATWRGTQVSAKVIPRGRESPVTHEELAHEVGLLMSLRHPNVLLFMCYSRCRDKFIVVTEYMPAGSLTAVLADEENPLGLRTRLQILKDVCSGMAYLHSYRPCILHCDLKSSNIMLGANMQAKVCDFGLAVFTRRGDKQPGVGANADAGGLLWTAPEVLRGGQFTTMSDVYAFGIVVWEAITCRTPYKGLDPAAVVRRVADEGLRPDCSDSRFENVKPLAGVMELCWSQEPSGESKASKAAAYPRGRIALMFTDIQQSTELWESSPLVMKKALYLHHSIMRAAIRRWNGSEVKTEADDSIMFRGLRVRMGIHVGAPDLEDSSEAGNFPSKRHLDYIGPDVNKAARVAASAKGGQILMSSSAQTEIELNQTKVAQYGELRLVGTKVFKGIAKPEVVYEFVVANLERDFEPPEPPRSAVLSMNLPCSAEQTLQATSVSELPDTVITALLAGALPAFDWGACRLAVANTTARAPVGTIAIGVVDSIEVMAMCMALQGADLGAGHNVSIVFFDDENSEDRARPAAELMEGYPVVGVIGSFTSRMSMALQDAGLAASRIPQVSHAATSPLLSDKTRFPHFLRTPATDTITTYAMVVMLSRYNVKRIAVMGTKDGYGEGAADQLTAYAERASPPIEVVTTVFFSPTLSEPDQVSQQLFDMVAAQAQAFVLFCTSPTCVPVLEQAHAMNLLTKPRVWILGAAVDSLDLIATQSPSLAEVIGDNTTIVVFSTSLGSGPVHTQFEEDLRKFTNRSSFSLWTYFAYDAALAYVIEEKRQPRDHEALYAALVGLRFTGATGSVSFDANGDRFTTITLSTWLPDARTLTVVGNWSVAGGLVVDPRYTLLPEKRPGGGARRGLTPLLMGLIAGSVGVGLALAAGVAAAAVIQRRTKRIAKKLYWETHQALVPSEEIVLGTEVGHGYFGAVYKATWRGTQVSAKAIPDSSVARRTIGELAHQVGALMSVRHPNVLLFMCYSYDNSRLIIVTEYMPAGSLMDVLADETQPLNLRTRLQILKDVCSGMAYLHSYRPCILHCDLKSSNIMLGANMQAKVSDFGLAVFTHKATTPLGVGANVNAGSTYWTAPEVLGGGPFSTKSDVYSFGIVVWETLTRKVPYGELNPLAVVRRVVVESLRPDCSDPLFQQVKPLTSAMELCWSQEPSARPAFVRVVDLLEGCTEAMADQLQSTELWEECPVVMKRALYLHHRIMRSTLQKWNGAEVKTEGDVFMIAFQSTVDAVCFAAEAQTRLASASWDPELLAHEASDDSIVFRGLRVRMGIHVGEPEVDDSSEASFSCRSAGDGSPASSTKL
eukprot:m51a1_g7793 putative serine-threonine protein (1778) ;mRNA; f:20013-29956